jgi:hypothetical protein
MRKKGANVKLRDEEIDGLQWTGPLKFTVASLPAEEGVYSLFEQGTCLFVGATEDIQESITEQRRIANVPLFGDELWIPNPGALAWRYAQLPDWTSDQRFGLVRALVGRWQPVFNIPRGSERLAA